jgi:hypothetical protein
MSYIDSFDHDLVGFFGGLPIYHPTQDISGAAIDPQEFACNSRQLILGGGEGEHPALVLADPSSAALHFAGLAWTLLPERQPLSAPTRRALDRATSCWQCLSFAGWDMKTHADFYARCTAACYPTPFDPERHGTVEEWLVASLGEFVYFALPELAADAEEPRAELRTQVSHPIFWNVLTPPPGYPVGVGRRHNQAGNLVWGSYPWVCRRDDGSGDQATQPNALALNR